MANKNKIDTADKNSSTQIFAARGNSMLSQALKLQFFQDQFARLTRITSNPNLSNYAKASRLNALAESYRNLKMSDALRKYNIDGMGVLERSASASATQFTEVEKVKEGKKPADKTAPAVVAPAA